MSNDAIILPQTCEHCDFGSGHRGMDSCGKCDGTGQVFRVKFETFPNTQNGYENALEAIIFEMSSREINKHLRKEVKHFGILNMDGNFWTTDTFRTAEDAQKHITEYGSANNLELSNHTVVPVKLVLETDYERKL